MHNRHTPSAAKATLIKITEPMMKNQNGVQDNKQRQWINKTNQRLSPYSNNAVALLNTALLMKWLTLIKRNSFVMSIISLFGILDVIFKVSDTVHGTMTLISFIY